MKLQEYVCNVKLGYFASRSVTVIVRLPFRAWNDHVIRSSVSLKESALLYISPPQLILFITTIFGFHLTKVLQIYFWKQGYF